MSQILRFQFGSDPDTGGRGGWWRGETEILETENLGKRLEWRERDETWWEEKSEILDAWLT